MRRGAERERDVCVQALDRAWCAHPADAEGEPGPQRAMACLGGIEGGGEVRILTQASFERAHATLCLDPRDGPYQPGAAQPERGRERLAIRGGGRLFDDHRPAGTATGDDAHRRYRRAPQLPLESRKVLGGDHAHSLGGRSTDAHGEGRSVRKLIVIGIVIALAVLFVQPIRAYRAAQEELAGARVELREVRIAKERAVEERDALGTREMLVREARRRGYIFPGETPFSVGER